MKLQACPKHWSTSSRMTHSIVHPIDAEAPHEDCHFLVLQLLNGFFLCVQVECWLSREVIQTWSM